MIPKSDLCVAHVIISIVKPMNNFFTHKIQKLLSAHTVFVLVQKCYIRKGHTFVSDNQSSLLILAIAKVYKALSLCIDHCAHR